MENQRYDQITDHVVKFLLERDIVNLETLDAMAGRDGLDQFQWLHEQIKTILSDLEV